MKNETSKANLLKLIPALLVLAAVVVLAKFVDIFSDYSDMITGALSMICKVAVAVVFVWALYYVLTILLDYFKAKGGRVGAIAALIDGISKFAIVLIACCWIASIVGIGITAILTTVSMLALAAGLGADRLVADILAGLCLMFENTCQPGDMIEVNGHRGKVLSLTLRTLTLEDGQGNTVTVRNGELGTIVKPVAAIAAGEEVQ